MSAPSSSSSSADAPSAHASAATVTVEDESTKLCSVCLADWPKSAHSSAQLKKKDKRACHLCVAKKGGATAAQQEAAAEAAAKGRKEAMKDAFATRLNAATPQTASACLCCKSKAAVCSVACIRCSVPCCSLKCFDGHDCDVYLESKRTMPTARIPEEDRFASADEIVCSWEELLSHLPTLPPAGSHRALQACSSGLEQLSVFDPAVRGLDWSLLCLIAALSVCYPWWSPACCARLGFKAVRLIALIEIVSWTLWFIGDAATVVMEHCVAGLDQGPPRFRGSFPCSTTELISACSLPSRMTHKLLTLQLFISRAMPSSWLQQTFGSTGQVESTQFGLLPSVPFPANLTNQLMLTGYLEHVDQSGLRTLVPLSGSTDPSRSFTVYPLRQHLGHTMLWMYSEADVLLLDRGLTLLRDDNGTIRLSAVTGWTGRPIDSFTRAPTESRYTLTAVMEQILADHTFQEIHSQVNAELAARKQPGFFDIIPAIQSMVAKEDWPARTFDQLFIPTPQLGLECELVELSLLESLVEEAAAGDARAQLLLAHIEEECAAPIAEVIAHQRSRLEQMLEDQAEQLRIHAEAVARAELRGRIKAAAVEGSSEGASASSIGASSSSSDSAFASALGPTSASSTSALAPSSAASAVAPSVSAGSSTALSSASSGSATGESAVAYSWAASKAYASLADVCTAGRAKYKTITSAALRFLHTLRPVSVNRSGGSHTVFHFASGKPVTLVQPHGGDGSVSRHKATRLYAVLHEAALQQLSPAEALPAAGSGRRAALTEAAL